MVAYPPLPTGCVVGHENATVTVVVAVMVAPFPPTLRSAGVVVIV